MTQTVKKRAAILLLFAIAVASLFYVSTLPGEFLITTRSRLDGESHDFSETVLSGTGISWTGFWTPTILEVKLLGVDQFFQKELELPFEIFVEEDGHIGILKENDLGAPYQIEKVRNYRIKDKRVHLVFMVDSKAKQDLLKSAKSLRITYSTLGFRKTKTLVFTDEEGTS
jgi:hypothetical protein